MINLTDVQKISTVKFAIVLPLSPCSGKWQAANDLLRIASGVFHRRENHELTVDVPAQGPVLCAHLALDAGLRPGNARLHRRKQIITFQKITFNL